MPTCNFWFAVRRSIGPCCCALALYVLSTTPARADLQVPAEGFTGITAPLTADQLVVQEITAPAELPGSIDLTAESDSLWDRVRNGFAMINLNDDLVIHYQQKYQNRPEGLRRLIERSRPYLYYIVDELEARGMPTELALLPMVESAFNPMAHSPANASGLWQFIPSTGRRFNLEQNWWRDERRDIIASTNAALDYLQTIYEMHGDWHLALASYNWGEGAVKRAIEKNEARGLPTDYPNLKMPNETRHYVPKLQALKNILGNPILAGRAGIPNIPNEPYFKTLETRRPIDITTAARLADMSLEEFRHLNPSHNRPIIQPDTAVVLPADKVETFQNNLELQQSGLSQWQAYTVKSAERVSDIASRVGASTSELIKANSLPGNVRLAVGSHLLVPGQGNADNLRGMLGMGHSPIIIQPEPRKVNTNNKIAKGSSAPQKGKPASKQVSNKAPSTGKKNAQPAKGKKRS